MKIFKEHRLFSIFIFSFTCLLMPGELFAQYAPPAGQAGTTAMHKDSSAFVAWASHADIVRGLQDISDSTLGYTSIGNENSPLGLPNGDVVSLGDGGYATLSFTGIIYNGPGPDFAVFENSFSDTFLELGFVEVSSDGINFFRFPCVSLTDTTVQMDNNANMDATEIYNLAGKYRAQYGLPFDLEELKGTPGLNTNNITHVRIIDVIGSLDGAYATYDSSGSKINDPWTTAFSSGGFDLDAVGAIHCTGCETGMTSLNKAKHFSVYPNPVAENTVITITLGNQKQALLSITNMKGSLMKQQILYEERNEIPLNNLPSGIYFMQIKGKAYFQTQKIVIY